MLGGFAPAGHLPLYIVQVTAKRGQSWTIEVSVDEERRCYQVDPIAPALVPWRYWLGSSTGTRPLIDGDEPMVSAFKRMKASRFPRLAK